MSELELQDAILRNALELQRLSANDEREALAILRELERDLQTLLSRGNLSDAGKREIEAVLREASKAIQTRFAGIATVVDTQAIALIVAEQTVDAMSTLGAILKPSPERLASLTKDILIDGAPSSSWWAKQSDDLAFRFAREVRQGVIEGSTNEQIVSRIFGRGDEPGIMDTTRRNVRSLVHSSVMTASNRARLETFRKNNKFTRGVRWLATLDSHTCRTCAALDGSTWDHDGKPLDGTTLDFQLPPAHFACRCVASPLPKSFDEIFGRKGIDDIFNRGRVRASANGPTTATTFSEFLKRQPDEFVEEMLGTERAELWRAGKITLRDLISGSGRELTLDQIRARIRS